MTASVGKRDPTKQGHRTPPEFLTAIGHKFGPIGFDLAAAEGHEVGPHGCSFTPEMDSLVQDWGLDWGQVVYLNPPFADIRPWVRKLDLECQNLKRWTLCLIPASMGSRWWVDHVLGKCMAFGVPRMKFIGAKDAYPKDLALLAYGYGVHGTGYWDWRKNNA